VKGNMRLALQLVALAVVAAALASPATAGNDSAPGQAKKQEPTSSYSVTYTDTSGKEIKTRSGGGALRWEDGGAGSGSGCATVDVGVRSSTLFGNTAYVFHHVKNWCWSFPHVTSESSGTYFSDVDPNYLVRGTWGHGWHFSWNGSGHGGHLAYRQAHVDNCAFHYGCVRTEYPWVEIRTYGNGQWSASSGI
jgi:hypothetical protein